MNILMVGGGAMGAALSGCWRELSVTTIDPIQVGCLRSIEDLPPSYRPDVIVLAVKPQLMESVLPAYVEAFAGIRCIWVSVAAGLPIAFYHQRAPECTFVRCMPNLPVLYKEGAIGLYSAHQSAVSETMQILFSRAGQVVWVDNEADMDAVTALSGSGPAYCYLMVECLAKAGMALGLSEVVATTLARQTVIGAGVMLKNDARDASVLREHVTSAKGTTEAALHVLMQDDRLAHTFMDAMQAAYERSQALSKIE